jgi:Leucine-rich repeat (LRR) protein
MLNSFSKDIYFDNLKVHDNQITSIDEEIGNLLYLKSINLSHNELKNFPNSICKLKNLVLINASYNALTTLPKNIGYLDLLEDLVCIYYYLNNKHLIIFEFIFKNLSNNLIIELPKSFGFFNKLRNLNLSSNQINILIPEVVYSISKLLFRPL